MTTATPRTLARSTLSIDAAIARFRMTDAGSRNAFTQALKDDFAELVRVVRADAAIRAVVIEGSDGAFCAGGDLKSLAARRGPGGELLRDDEVVSIALVDLDGDGRRDILAFADASYFCGSAGCVPRLYRLPDGSARWQELPIETEATINGAPVDWSVGDADASGWKTLGFDNGVVRLTFGWTGEAYSNR